jgi:hypothetical protein
VAESKRPDSRGLSFFDITDFSPGIYDASNIVATGAPTPNPGIFPAPPGAADANFTWACKSLPTGGLGPMPAITATATLAAWGITGFGPVEITALTNSFQTSADEMVIAVSNFNSGTSSQTVEFFSYVISTASLHAIASQTDSYNGERYYCCYPYTEYITSQPVVVLPLVSPDGPLAGNLLVYPSVSAPTSFGADSIATHQAGVSIGHQGRLVIAARDATPWPVTPTPPGPNELFSYTDPPQTETWPVQAEQFGPEYPFGYGAINSVSAGELFCIKTRGGAIIIQGDLNNPTVTTLPGVKSTGVFYGRSGTNQNGLHYCAFAGGAYAWNGGNASAKISQQLDDNFFVNDPRHQSPNYGFYVERWDDWMLFSNNFVLDSNTGSWWRLSNPATFSFFWYVPGWDNNIMYAALAAVPGQTTPFIATFDRTVPAASFQWQSLPIKIPSEDRTSTARELVIRASNPYADAAPQIIATLVDDKGNTSVLDTWTMTTGINTIQETRLNAALKQTNTVAVRLVCSGTDFAPVVHGLSMGYRTREHTGIT